VEAVSTFLHCFNK